MRPEELEQQLAEYVDGVLSPEREAAIEQQLAADPELTEQVDALRRLLPLVQALPEEEPPAGLSEKIFRATTRRRGFTRLFQWDNLNSIFSPAAAVATILLIAIIGLAVFGIYRLTDKGITEEAMVLTKQQSTPDLPVLPLETAKPDDRSMLAMEDRLVDKAETSKLRDAELPAKDATTALAAADKGGEGFAGAAGKIGGGELAAGYSGDETALGGAADSVAGKTLETAAGDDRDPDRLRSADEKTAAASPWGKTSSGVEGPGTGMGVVAEDGDLLEMDELREEESVGRLAAAEPAAVEQKKADAPRALPASPAAEDAAHVVERWDGVFCRIDDETTVIVADPEEWAELWTTVHAGMEPAPDVPELDFAEVVVISVFLGERRSGGYAVSIREVRRAGDVVQLRVKETSPAGPGGLTTVMTQPCSLVVAPRVLDGLTITPETVVQIVK